MNSSKLKCQDLNVISLAPIFMIDDHYLLALYWRLFGGDSRFNMVRLL